MTPDSTKQYGYNRDFLKKIQTLLNSGSKLCDNHCSLSWQARGNGQHQKVIIGFSFGLV